MLSGAVAEQGSAAAMRALPNLLGGSTTPLRYASRVNPDLCTGCRTCETVCPHGAIRMTEEGAVSAPAFCQACGLCAASCPAHAAELMNFTDRQVLEQAAVAFDELPDGEPKILALLCDLFAGFNTGSARFRARPSHGPK